MKIPKHILQRLAKNTAAKKKRKSTARKPRAINTNAYVETACRTIEDYFGLPGGSVRIALPNGKNARRDKRISGLIRDWEQSRQ